MRKLQKIICLVAILLLAITMLCGCPKKETSADSKTITFALVDQKGETKEYEITTQKGTLAEALDEAELIEYDQSGLYTTIAGIRADYTKDGAFWWLKVNGEDATTGMNDIKIEDGGRYEAIHTPA